MAILVDQSTTVICQGFTGTQGSFHSERALTYGTRIVAGVTPGKGGSEHLGLPVFDSVAEAKTATAADTSLVFVPPAQAAEAMLEAIAADLALIVCVTERIPLLDMVKVKQALANSRTRLIGPNSFGIITPPVCQLGVMPSSIFRRGKIGIVSRPSTLTYEAVAQTTEAGLGQSTCVGIGADPIPGTSFKEILRLFFDDPETEGVVLIGEIGGSGEEEAAEYLQECSAPKPVVAYIAGKHAPSNRRMGHAGAIISGRKGSVQSKVDALQRAGVYIASSPTSIGSTMLSALSDNTSIS